MSEMIVQQQQLMALPQPRVGISIRAATLADLPFMDRLQKQHGKALGYFPTKQFEGYIEGGHVLVAEEGLRTKDLGLSEEAGDGSLSSSKSSVLSPKSSVPVGYVISRDRYLKRDELGVIYQLCVSPGQQRGYIGAALVQAVFERAAYGCRLFCCWCAQDLAANRFWEAMGFVPVAFRTGSTSRGVASRQASVVSGKAGSPALGTDDCRLKTARVHIFWQKRIRRGDTATPWWFPSKTEGGALRADRLVLPIPPGVGWEEVLPFQGENEGLGTGEEGLRTKDLGLSEEKAKSPRRAKAAAKSLVLSPKSSRAPVQFGRPGAVMPVPQVDRGAVADAAAGDSRPADGPPVRARKAKAKCDPKLVAAARELRDRWLEEVNAGRYLPGGAGKYEVSKTLGAGEGTKMVDAGPLPNPPLFEPEPQSRRPSTGEGTGEGVRLLAA